MAKFIYRMQNVLDIKLRLETQAKTEYAEKNAILYEEEEKMRELLVRMRQYENQAKLSAQGTVNIQEIKRCNEAAQIMKEYIRQQAIQIRIAQKNVDQARIHLNEAMKDRKIHEKLKEKAFDDFKVELNAQEMKEIDEVVSFSYNDNNKETGE